MDNEIWKDFFSGWIAGEVKGFYKGMEFPLLTSGALNSIFFGVYGNALRNSTENGSRLPSLTEIFLCGCLGGVAQLIIACPVDLIKIKMQLQTNGHARDWCSKGLTPYRAKHYIGPTACLQDLYRTFGLRGCYCGLGAMAIRDVPAYGLYMVTYEYLIRKFAGAESKASPATLMFCGATAGGFSWLSIVPFDVIKSRLQADDPGKRMYKNFLDCAIKSYKAEGFGVFTRGASMVVWRALPTNGAIFYAYVTTNNLIEHYYCSSSLSTQQQL